MEGFIGEVKYFAGTYAPSGWMFCQGQQLSIVQFTPLYSLISNQYGGDGRTYFNLPDFRGRMALCAGQGTGFTLRKQGETGGLETVQISSQSMPNHNHGVKCEPSPAPPQLKNTPVGNLYTTKSAGTAFSSGSVVNQMYPGMLANEGQSGVHENMPPWLCMNYIICVYGYYPIRP